MMGAALRAACGVCVAMLGLGAAGCSSSSSSGAVTSDAGDDGTSFYGSPPSDGSAEGEGGGPVDAGPDVPACKVPDAATFFSMYMGATMSCTVQLPNGQCDSMSYRLECMTTDTPGNLPQPPTSLMCSDLPNNNNPLIGFYCCPCN